MLDLCNTDDKSQSGKQGYQAELQKDGAEWKMLSFDSYEVACSKNLRSLCTAALQFMQDHEKFAFDSFNFKEKLMPYIKSDSVFRCPVGKDDAVGYSFNHNLENMTFNEFDKISDVSYKVVMFYEGKNEQFDFRHNGRTIICFANGVRTDFSKDDPALKNSVQWKW